MGRRQGESDQITSEVPTQERPENRKLLKQIRNLTGHSQSINRLAWSPDNKTLASSSYDYTVRLWNMLVKEDPLVLSGPTDWVTSVTWSPDGRALAAGSGDSKIWLWNTETGQIIKAFKAHTRTIFSTAWSPDGRVLASASSDTSVALWHIPSLKLLTMLQGHSGAVYRVAWSPNGRELASCSEDGTVRIWEAHSGQLKRILEGHTGPIYDLAWSPDGRILASASQDMTIRLWGKQVGVLEGHTGIVNSLSFSYDGRFLASKSLDNTVRLWRCDTWETVEIIPEPASPYWTAGLAFHTQRPVLATLGDENLSVRIWRFSSDALNEAEAVEQSIRYTSAKIVLVGDSGVGKTALADALMGHPVQGTMSTHGRHVLRFDSQENIIGSGVREIHEAYLWDMAGQPAYRLIHQLHLNQVVVSLVVFDVKSDIDPFAGVRFWARALRHAQKLKGGDWPLKMFLVAGRTDRGGVGVSRQRIEGEVQRLKFDRYFETSATQGWGIKELEAAVHNAINWNVLPKVSSTTLFQKIKDFLTRVRESGRLLHTVEQLYDTFLTTLEAQDETPDLRAQFETCIGLVESQALIRRFSFGDMVLLQPEILDAYASAMISSAKDEADSDGSIVEEDVINVRFKMPVEERIPDPKEEQLLLIATVEDLIRHEIALRDEDTSGVSILIFPSQSARQYPDPPEADNRTAIFTFEGPVLNVYATLAVRLWNSKLFISKDVYENATFFYEAEEVACRIYLRSVEEGKGELSVHFDENLTDRTRRYVEEYINAHLLRRASPGTLKRKRVFICQKCDTPVTDLQVERRRKLGFDWIQCNVCNARVELKVEAPANASQSLLRQAIITKLDKEADTQRERQMAISVIQGKRLTGDYDIFFCHNGADKATVKRIGEHLQAYSLLPWLDEWELPPGQPWQPLVEQQLMQSKMMAFFVGANGTGTWQEQELYMFMNLKRPVILVFLPDAPRNVRYPGFLSTATWVDFRKNDPDPIEQMVWGITGQHPRRNQ